jgi:hypothetical protein
LPRGSTIPRGPHATSELQRSLLSTQQSGEKALALRSREVARGARAPLALGHRCESLLNMVPAALPGWLTAVFTRCLATHGHRIRVEFATSRLRAEVMRRIRNGLDQRGASRVCSWS